MAEGKIKKLMDEKIGSLGEKLREYIAKEKGKRVKKISIENGQLKVEYAKIS